MTNVVSFADKKAEREPHWAGTAHCVGCHAEWTAVAPLGTLWLECPNCGLPKGTPKHPFGAGEGDLQFRCNCGGEALTAYVHKGLFRLRCMGCGEDQTEAIYGEGVGG